MAYLQTGGEVNPGPGVKIVTRGAYESGTVTCPGDVGARSAVKARRFGSRFGCPHCHVEFPGPGYHVHPTRRATPAPAPAADVAASGMGLGDLLERKAPLPSNAVVIEVHEVPQAAVVAAAPAAAPVSTEVPAQAGAPQPPAPGHGTPAPAPPAVPVPPAEGHPALIALRGRELSRMEVSEFGRHLGGRSATSSLSRMAYEAERRLVTWRSVNEVKAPIDFQQISVSFYVCNVLCILLAGLVAMATGLYGLGVVSCTLPVSLVVLAASIALVRFNVLLALNRPLGIADENWDLVWLDRVVRGLLALAAIFSHWGFSALAALAFALVYVWRGSRTNSFERRTPAFMLLIPIYVLCSGFALYPPALRLLGTPVFISLACRFSVLRFFLDLEVRVMPVCPHALSCVLSEYAAGTDATAVASNTRGKLLRLACLPIPDTVAQQVLSGTEQAVYFLAPREPFFGVGAIPLGSPR